MKPIRVPRSGSEFDLKWTLPSRASVRLLGSILRLDPYRIITPFSTYRWLIFLCSKYGWISWIHKQLAQRRTQGLESPAMYRNLFKTSFAREPPLQLLLSRSPGHPRQVQCETFTFLCFQCSIQRYYAFDIQRCVFDMFVVLLCTVVPFTALDLCLPEQLPRLTHLRESLLSGFSVFAFKLSFQLH